jgi:two-component system, NarL family, response regulator NreC
MRKTRVLIADDHVGLRESLAMYIDTQDDMRVVGQASNGREAVELATKARAQVAVIDLTMPDCDGIAAINELKRLRPSIRCLVLTMHEDSTFLRAALAAGADGYITKRAASSELLHAIREVAGGRAFINAVLNDGNLDELIREPAPAVVPREILSERERGVLQRVAHGYTNKEIAGMLGLSRTSVDTYRLRAAQKLGLKSRADVVRHAINQGWLNTDPMSDHRRQT